MALTSTDRELPNVIFNKLTKEQYAELLASGQINEDEFYITTDDEYTTEEIDSMLADKVGIEDVYNKHQVDVKLSKKANVATTLEGYGIEDITNINTTNVIDNNGVDVSNLTINNNEVILTNNNLNLHIEGGEYIDVKRGTNTLYEYSGYFMPSVNTIVTNNIIIPVGEFTSSNTNIVNNSGMVDTPASEMYYLKLSENDIEHIVPIPYKMIELFTDEFYTLLGATDLSEEGKRLILTMLIGEGNADLDCQLYLLKTKFILGDTGEDQEVLMLIYPDNFGNYIVGMYGMFNLEPINVINSESNKLSIDWNETAIRKIENIELLPSQTDNAGKFLTTDGTSASWSEIPPQITKVSELENDSNFISSEEVNEMFENIELLPSQTDNAGKVLTTDGTTTSWRNETPAAIFKDW